MLTKRNLIAGAVLIAIVGTVVWAIRFSNPQELMRSILLWISQLGPWAPVLFIVSYIVACLVFFPSVILTLGAGVLFGVVKGTLLVAIASTIGGCCAFTIARFMAREWVTRKFGSYEHFKAIDEAVAEKGWKIIVLMRLSPVFPFLALNYLFGLTKIPLPHFAVATFFGLIHLSSMFVYLGKLAGDLANIGPVKSNWTTFHYVIGGFGLLTTIIVTTYITNIARKALNLPEKKSAAH